MSSFYCTDLKIKDREKVPEVLAMATELTKQMSLVEMGFDLTDPTNQNEFQSFNTFESGCGWSDFSGASKWINENEIIDAIIHRFPDTEFIYEFYDNGPLAYKEYIKGDFCEQLVQRTLDIGVDNPEAFTRLADVLGVEQSYPFFIFPLGDQLVSKVEPEMDNIIDRVTKIVPDQKLYCIKVDNTDQGDYYSKKGVVEDGKIDWQQVSLDEGNVMDKTIESMEVRWENKPNEEVFKCLFDDSYRDEILALISKEERKVKPRWWPETEHDEDDLPF